MGAAAGGAGAEAEAAEEADGQRRAGGGQLTFPPAPGDRSVERSAGNEASPGLAGEGIRTFVSALSFILSPCHPPGRRGRRCGCRSHARTGNTKSLLPPPPHALS